jgi:hypothetical protein
MSNEKKLAGFYLLVASLLIGILLSLIYSTINESLGLIPLAVILFVAAFHFIPYYDTNILTTNHSEFRIRKITRICDTIEQDPEFRIEQRTSSLLFKEDSWIRLASRTKLEDAQVILENLKKGMTMECSIKKEVIE